MPEKKSLYEEIAKGVADAITDVREKVVEEPWFGRVVNERQVMEVNWGWPPAHEAQPCAPDKDHEHEIDEGIDR